MLHNKYSIIYHQYDIEFMLSPKFQWTTCILRYGAVCHMHLTD